MNRLQCGFVVALALLLAFYSTAPVSLAGDGGGVNARIALEHEQARCVAILDDSFSTWVKPINVDPYLDFKDSLKEATGFEYLQYYTLMSHYGTNSGSPSQNVNGQFHSINAYTPHHGCRDAGSLIFYYMHIGQYTETTAGQLSNNLGFTSGLNDSAVNNDLFRYVGWYQPLMDGTIELDMGQFLLRDLFDLGNYGSDDTRNFVSEILSANPSSTLPAAGLGLAATLHITDDWRFGGGFSDANARIRDLWNFSTFSKGDYAWMGYLSYQGCVRGVGKANYLFSMYSIDASDQGGYSRGLSTILEQDIGKRHVAFFKYNRADERRGATTQSLSGGWLRKGFYIWEDDLLGFGAGWGDPTDPNRRDEYLLEWFWRAQLTPGVQITPDVQLWLNPSQTPGQDVQAVFTLRALFEI